MRAEAYMDPTEANKNICSDSFPFIQRILLFIFNRMLKAVLWISTQSLNQMGRMSARTILLSPLNILLLSRGVASVYPTAHSE